MNSYLRSYSCSRQYALSPYNPPSPCATGAAVLRNDPILRPVPRDEDIHALIKQGCGFLHGRKRGGCIFLFSEKTFSLRLMMYLGFGIISTAALGRHGSIWLLLTLVAARLKNRAAIFSARLDDV